MRTEWMVPSAGRNASAEQGDESHEIWDAVPLASAHQMRRG